MTEVSGPTGRRPALGADVGVVGLSTGPIGRAVRRAGFVLLLLAVLVAVVVEGRSLLLFHAVTPWTTPERIHFCGRDYDRAGLVSPQTVTTEGRGAVLQRLLRGPVGQPVYGYEASRQQRAELGVPCTMVLYLRDGAGYRSFILSGGP